MPKAGIYIHIPFCAQACSYCNFHFSTSRKNMDNIIEGIVTEMDLRSADWQGFDFDTLYFGGGTPSLLDPSHLEKIRHGLETYFGASAFVEATLEANPDDVQESKLKAWKTFGINRLSIGVQSFDDASLEWMNRTHRAEDTFKALELARKTGFEKFSIDLIYGLPNQSPEEWVNALNQVNELGVNHISAYALTVEEKTALHNWIRKGLMPHPDEGKAADDFKTLQAWAEKNGWTHYELSNLAKPGCESIHNSNYWNRKPYLGLGPAAHGLKKNQRYWNIPNNPQYLASVQAGNLLQEKEVLSPSDQFNEWVMIGLRTERGLGLDELNHHPNFTEHFQNESQKLVEMGQLEIIESRIRIPRKHRFLSDGIASDLFWVDA